MRLMSGHRSGPVRSDQARQAILSATAAEFIDKGYAFTIQGVAQRAKAGKQTIYRWWPTKADLLADCLAEGQMWDHGLSPHDTGDLRRDLLEWLTRLLGVGGAGEERRILRSFITAATNDDELAQRLRLLLSSSGDLEVRLQRAVTSGELPPHASVREIEDALVGVVVLATVGWIDPVPDVLAAAVDHSVASPAPHPRLDG